MISRRGFLGFLTRSAAALVVAPSIVKAFLAEPKLEIPKEPEPINLDGGNFADLEGLSELLQRDYTPGLVREMEKEHIILERLRAR